MAAKKKERSRNKDGTFRKKRKDAGKHKKGNVSKKKHRKPTLKTALANVCQNSR